ncbi:dehydrogenase/reductase SDR family member 2, mitochondrial-like [Eulemur rufifrons]|uniref:dehydrogenase/reductase SDR family member 2, mitochondrial-like n=1 Tax=Eulemur rufifrons TaxID=859984 RepID=UPI003742AC27
MLRAVPWTLRGLLGSLARLSARTHRSRAERSHLLADKVAVLTGSTEAIGFAIAPCLAQDGAHVVVSSRKQQNVDRAMAALQGEGLNMIGTVCHVGKDRELGVATVKGRGVEGGAGGDVHIQP